MSRYPPFCGFGLFIVFIIYSFLVVFYGAHLSLHLDEAIHFGEYLEYKVLISWILVQVHGSTASQKLQKNHSKCINIAL